MLLRLCSQWLMFVERQSSADLPPPPSLQLLVPRQVLVLPMVRQLVLGLMKGHRVVLVRKEA